MNEQNDKINQLIKANKELAESKKKLSEETTNYFEDIKVLNEITKRTKITGGKMEETIIGCLKFSVVGLSKTLN